jgi:hypothetical protein
MSEKKNACATRDCQQALQTIRVLETSVPTRPWLAYKHASVFWAVALITQLATEDGDLVRCRISWWLVYSVYLSGFCVPRQVPFMRTYPTTATPCMHTMLYDGKDDNQQLSKMKKLTFLNYFDMNKNQNLPEWPQCLYVGWKCWTLIYVYVLLISIPQW